MEIMDIKEEKGYLMEYAVKVLEEKHEQWQKTETLKDIIQGNFLMIKYVTLYTERILCVLGKTDPEYQKIPGEIIEL